MLVQNIPIYDTPNYAPLAPLLELEERSEPKQDDLCQQIRAKYEELNERDKGIFESISETAYTIAAFTQGKQTWQRNWYNGGNWELSMPDKNTNPNLTRSFNKMQFQVSQMLEDLISSNPDFEPADMFKSFRHEKQVKAAKALWHHYESRFYDDVFNSLQSHSLITTGSAIEELVYDAGIKGATVYRDIWGEVEIETFAGQGRCFECEFEGPAEAFYEWDDPNAAKEFKEIQQAAGIGDAEASELLSSMPMALTPQCSNCGSFDTDVQPKEAESVPSVVGVEEYKLGDFVLNNLPIQACRFDVGVRPEESSYFIDKQYISLSKIKHMFGRDVRIGEGDADDHCLDLLYKMPRIGASIGGSRMTGNSTMTKPKSAMLVRMSLSAEEAADIDIPDTDELKTVSGGKLKPGKTLADVCEGDGCTILGFNGLKHIYGIYKTHHSKRLSSAVYFSRPNAGTGRGAEDLTEIQKRVNKLDKQQTAAVDGAAPGYAFVEGAIDEQHAKKIGFPNARIPIRREFFNQTREVNKLIQQFQPQQVAPQLFAYAGELEKMMQMTAHNVSMGGTVFDADNKTATGARILEATAQAITIPMLQSKAGGRRRTIKNLLCNYKERFGDVKQKMVTSGKSRKHFNEVEVSGNDIDPDVDFVIVENSQIPQNYYLRKVDYMAFANAVSTITPGGYMELKATDPELLKILSKTFGVDIGPDEYDQITEICRSRMQNAFEIAPMLAEMLIAAPMGPPAPTPSNDFQLTEMEYGNTIADEDQEPTDTPENLLMELIFTSLDVPIRPKEKNHDLKAEWFKDFLDTPDGFDLDPMGRDICFEFILRHEDAIRTAMNADMMLNSMGETLAAAPSQALQAKGEQMAEMGMMPPPPMEGELMTPALTE